VLGVASIAAVVVIAVDYHIWAEFALSLHGMAIALLAAVLLFGKEVGGNKSWLVLGPLDVSALRVREVDDVRRGRVVSRQAGARPPSLRSGAPASGDHRRTDALDREAARHGDGADVRADHAGRRPPGRASLADRRPRDVRRRRLGAARLAAPQALSEGTHLDRRRSGTRPSGVGYQVRQSKIAVGSGRLTGKGLFKGTQTRLNFLPAQHTDFVLAVIAEELGFIGAAAVLALLYYLLYRGLLAARSSQDRLGTYLSLLVVSWLAGQSAINIGMVLGLMPTIGVPCRFSPTEGRR
jgi:hypothetical protein